MHLKLLIIPLLTGLLTACGTVNSDVRYACPPLTDYSPAFEKQVADEKVAAEKAHLGWPSFVNDYGRLRAECRATVK